MPTQQQQTVCSSTCRVVSTAVHANLHASNAPSCEPVLAVAAHTHRQRARLLIACSLQANPKLAHRCRETWCSAAPDDIQEAPDTRSNPSPATYALCQDPGLVSDACAARHTCGGSRCSTCYGPTIHPSWQALDLFTATGQTHTVLTGRSLHTNMHAGTNLAFECTQQLKQETPPAVHSNKASLRRRATMAAAAPGVVDRADRPDRQFYEETTWR